MSYMDQPPAGAPVGGSPTFTLASWGKRVGAYLIDGVIVWVIYMVGIVTKSGALIALLGLVAVAFSIWNYVWKQGTTGQTIGKGVLGIKLVREADALPVGPGLSFGRGICHIADSVFYIGFLWPLWDPKRQTFADKICHTVVVEA